MEANARARAPIVLLIDNNNDNSDEEDSHKQPRGGEKKLHEDR